MLDAPVETTSKDVIRGYPLGHVPDRMVSGSTNESPRQALEGVISTCLRRPPCVVAFSGGRDSSAVLAIATHVARREGLDEPIPVTRRFADAPATQESDWQELVVRHLGLSEWVLEEIRDEMDLVGPLAQRHLLQHGVLFPTLLHANHFVLRHAEGGSALDGEGGDEVTGPSAHRVAPVAQVLRRARRGSLPTLYQLRRAGSALAPSAYRAKRAKRRAAKLPITWLKAAAYEELAEDYAAGVAVEPLSARRSIRMLPARRTSALAAQNLRLIASDYGTDVMSPFLHPDVVRAVSVRAGQLGFTSRSEALDRICGDLLPSTVIRRTSKAEFNPVVFSRYTREFAEAWSGNGVDPLLVDADALRALWRGPKDNSLSAALLQTAWLADNGGNVSAERGNQEPASEP